MNENYKVIVRLMFYDRGHESVCRVNSQYQMVLSRYLVGGLHG